MWRLLWAGHSARWGRPWAGGYLQHRSRCHNGSAPSISVLRFCARVCFPGGGGPAASAVRHPEGAVWLRGHGLLLAPGSVGVLTP